ncbi:hypothetical protein ACFX2C_015019 [Malus domestica]
MSIKEISEEDHILLGTEVEGSSGVEILRRELTPVGSPMKRRAEVQGIELMQSPHKKNMALESTEEVPIEYQDKWEFMEEVLEAKRIALIARKICKTARGGGGWPSTAARSP